MKPFYDFLEATADEIVRIEYPTYEKAIPPMRRAITVKKAKIYAILQAAVKSRVEWLLNEIEKKVEEAERDMEIEEKEGDYETVEGYKFRKRAFEEVKHLIKTAFEDVMKDEPY